MPVMLVHLAGAGGEDRENFLAALWQELAGLGLRVALAKPEEPRSTSPHQGQAELRLGPGGLTLVSPGETPSLGEALRLLEGMDMVVSLLPPEEGKPVVEYCSPGAAPSLVGRAGLLALAGPGDFPEDPGVPAFGEPAGLARFLAQRSAARAQRRTLTILADGQPLKAKAFVRDIIANSLHGLLAPLKGAEGARRLEIIIEE